MSYQVNVTLTDEEYTALSLESAQSGKRLEDVLHEVLHQHIRPSVSKQTHELTRRDIQSYLYEEGITAYLPTDEPSTTEDDAERRHLAHLFGQGKPVSEMVIEDRGPR